LTNVNLTLKNFSSKTGGSIAFQATFAFTTGGETAIAANGTVKGSVELAVDSGSQAGDKRTISLSGLTLATDLVYDQRTETFAITTARRQRKA
jgi:phage gp45-like